MEKEKDFFKICFNTVAGLEVKNESQAIAKEVVLSEVEQLQQENQQLKIQISAREEEYRKLEQNWNTLFQWLIEQEEKAWDEVSRAFSTVSNKMQELERGVSDVED